MNKLSKILSEQKEQRIINSISTKKQFVDYVNEKLKSKEGYSEEMSAQISESLLSQFPDDYKKAIENLENFQMHG